MGGGTPSGVSSVASLAKTVLEPGVVDIAIRAVWTVDQRASGIFSVDLKEDGDGVPCVTEINAGRFLAGTNLLDLTGTHNMAVTYARLALGESVEIAEPYDAAPDHYIVRDLDTLPDILHADDLFTDRKAAAVERDPPARAIRPRSVHPPPRDRATSAFRDVRKAPRRSRAAPTPPARVPPSRRPAPD